MKRVRMGNTHLFELYKIIVRCEQRDGCPRPSAHIMLRGDKKQQQQKTTTNIVFNKSTLSVCDKSYI